ncbi:hypothetical protein [Paenibacillus faecalis]|uniref:hypothetical protein n=1 Tax=Paenibacillus faecalis TaxID=2079532 RepID=UPI000D0F3A76|nr:hypothetical protein [Paenibacillus faecalis]
MRKITDERLVLRNLKHIKIAYIVQTIGIIFILGFEFFQSGFEGMRDNPLWLVFILTGVVNAYLSMSLSVEHEQIRNPRKSLAMSVLVLAAVAAGTAYLTSNTPNLEGTEGLLLGIILFICGLVPLVYVYRLRVKQQQDAEDE